MVREEIKIIFADDSKLALNTLKTLLISYGFKKENLTQAKDGLELLTILEKTEEKKEKIDIILCDWNMPKFSGIQILERLKKMKYFENVPFIMITTESEKAQVIKALKIGLTNYIIKPFKEDIFIQKLFEALKI